MPMMETSPLHGRQFGRWMMVPSAQKLTRRTTLALGAAALARPALGQEVRKLRFVPHANLSSLDPVWSPAQIALDYSFMVCDQLYGLDSSLTPRPQMVEGHEVS